MGSKWNRVKLALGMNLCIYTPRNQTLDNDDEDDSLPPAQPPERRSSNALTSPGAVGTAAPLSQGLNRLRLSKSLSRSSSKKTCSICLGSMRRGEGHAIFTAECSHSFHFHCIASNVKHGNQICPVCRAKWKEIPLQSPSLDLPVQRARFNREGSLQNDALMPRPRQLPPRRNASLFHRPEPAIFNDDELLDCQIDSSGRGSSNKNAEDRDDRSRVTIKTYSEYPAVPQSSAFDDFTILLHLKAPSSNSREIPSGDQDSLAQISPTCRAPVDLVTVLDISGSMAGAKLALLKRAMGFVIQNLGPNDRLAVVAFSSNACRLFPLLRMSETGRELALQAVNSLVAVGGTNIAEGLRKGAKIMEDRREKNPVSSIILLSDGQDTNSVGNADGNRNQPGCQLLLPLSLHTEDSSSFKIPVHAFGFGADHDALSMHSISESSGGTFSFIETDGVIQDAFAQCIGGLLSVVVKNLQVSIECVHHRVHICSLEAGSYPNRMMSDQRTGSVDVGDMYADEERNFLVSVSVPDELSSDETSLLKVRCIYNDPLKNEAVSLESEEVRIMRRAVAGQEETSIEVDRQRNRLRVADAMAQARTAAETGDLARAVSILENCRTLLSETVSAKSQDRLCIALDAELKEMQERLASRRVYETSGRAYILSGLSSHSWQRATARGDSTDGYSLVQAYQTPSMTDMLTRSQATLSRTKPR
ncbi:Anaphase-promoting complex (APC), subunit 11 [Olea europaea subsp. europaea]|uniref:Anaphase-promoting complex (APC), subunit 11 n=1 Tax=Olea europaea subsp. europaea TaxID=158383 RepID=A0A8S0QXT3_OLEEU|nr:Anaphase-promoting complex (APC), subunit 11 [Olea europaea subsp. europaea]